MHPGSVLIEWKNIYFVIQYFVTNKNLHYQVRLDPWCVFFLFLVLAWDRCTLNHILKHISIRINRFCTRALCTFLAPKEPLSRGFLLSRSFTNTYSIWQTLRLHSMFHPGAALHPARATACPCGTPSTAPTMRPPTSCGAASSGRRSRTPPRRWNWGASSVSISLLSSCGHRTVTSSRLSLGWCRREFSLEHGFFKNNIHICTYTHVCVCVCIYMLVKLGTWSLACKGIAVFWMLLVTGRMWNCHMKAPKPWKLKSKCFICQCSFWIPFPVSGQDDTKYLQVTAHPILFKLQPLPLPWNLSSSNTKICLPPMWKRRVRLTWRHRARLARFPLVCFDFWPSPEPPLRTHSGTSRLCRSWPWSSAWSMWTKVEQPHMATNHLSSTNARFMNPQ